MSSPETRRIAKNTIFLYLRMIIVMGVSLYTSRIILDVLGIQDYGIYTLVAGIVILFSFLNSTMSSATSRFLSIEIGSGTKETQKKIFANALSLHLIIAALVVLLGETVGFWFVNNYISLPDGKLTVANIIFQFALLTIIFQIIQVPYNAAIISNEKMEAFAILEVVKVSLILAGTFSVKLFHFEHLIIYSIMLSSVAFFLLTAYVFYCRRNFPETKTKPRFMMPVIIPMVSFCAWDTYGNLCVTARSQGINIINNKFFGVIINAAGGIAMQVQNAILSFGSNIITAYRPPLIKLYSENRISEMQTLINQAIILSVTLFSIVAVPIFLEMPFILKFWLKYVPEYTCEITRLSLICSMLQCITMILNIPIHATGKIRRLSFIVGTIILFNLPVAYIIMEYCHKPYIAYYVMFGSNILQIFVTALIVKKLIPQLSLYSIFYRIILPTLLLILASFSISYILHILLDDGWLRLILESITYIAISSILMWCFILSDDIRKIIIQKILRK